MLLTKCEKNSKGYQEMKWAGNRRNHSKNPETWSHDIFFKKSYPFSLYRVEFTEGKSQHAIALTHVYFRERKCSLWVSSSGQANLLASLLTNSNFPFLRTQSPTPLFKSLHASHSPWTLSGLNSPGFTNILGSPVSLEPLALPSWEQV